VSQDELMEYLKSFGPFPPFKPNWFWNKEGDMLQAFWQETSYYGDWINHSITLYRCRKTDKVIGLSLSGVEHKILNESTDGDKS